MSLVSLSEQCAYTGHLSQALKGNFSLDDLTITNAYFKLTGLNPFTYQWLKVQRQAQVTQTTHPEFEAVKKDFTDHLDARISLLQLLLKNESSAGKKQPQETHFSSESESVKKARIESQQHLKIVQASLQIQDILFNCEEVINHLPSESEKFANDVLQAFIEKELSQQLSLLLPEEAKSQIMADFKSLQRALLTGPLQDAQSQLVSIRKRIKLFGDGLSKQD